MVVVELDLDKISSAEEYAIFTVFLGFFSLINI